MSYTFATRSRVLGVGLGALLAPVVAAGPAAADPDDSAWMRDGATRPAPAPPGGVSSEVLARGAAGEFGIRDEAAGVRLEGNRSTDVVLVRAVLDPGGSTEHHLHAGPSMVVVESGTLRMTAPRQGSSTRGCTERTYGPGTAFPHPSSVHTFTNAGEDPVVFYVTYFVPEGASPAPVPADAPRGC